MSKGSKIYSASRLIMHIPKFNVQVFPYINLQQPATITKQLPIDFDVQDFDLKEHYWNMCTDILFIASPSQSAEHSACDVFMDL